MNRPLLIGQAPGPRTDPELPLFPVPKTSAGGRLQELTGLRRVEYMKRFERVNLLPYFPGKHKRDDKFPMSPAKLTAAVLKPLLAGRVVIMVGRNVSNAFGFEADWHEWVDWPVVKVAVGDTPHSARVAVIPHPSGRNHWYNREQHREQARSFWAEFLGQETKKLLSSGDDGSKT